MSTLFYCELYYDYNELEVVIRCDDQWTEMEHLVGV